MPDEGSQRPTDEADTGDASAGAPARTVPPKTSWADVDGQPPEGPVDDGGARSTTGEARPAPRRPDPRAAPPPTPMMPTRRGAAIDRALGDDAGKGSLIDQMEARFEGEDAPETEPEPSAETEEDKGLLARLRDRFGFGDDEATEPSTETEEQTPPDAGEDGDPVPDADRPEPEPVPPSVAWSSPERAERPARPTQRGARIPARPDGNSLRRGPFARLEGPAPQPPTARSRIPGIAGLEGRPARAERRGFEPVDVPEPEVLHERVDAVLERFEGPGRGAR
jgi:hypothetical protein